MSPAMLPVITIDGPAGSGKSSVGKAIAQLLMFSYRDTGAEYRAVSVLCRRQGVDLEDPLACAAVAEEFIAGFRIPKPGHIHYNGEDLSMLIRTSEAGMGASLVGRHQPVRKVLVGNQRIRATRGCCVIEGRDAGTVICPEAIVKIYLTAHPEIRNTRRPETNAETIARRDLIDQSRTASPLLPADDAVMIDSSYRGIYDIAADIHRLYKERMYAH